jgi:hypothetical protein
MKNTETWEYMIKEQELDKTKEQLALRIGYAVIQLYGLANRYIEEEKKFNEWAKQESKE